VQNFRELLASRAVRRGRVAPHVAPATTAPGVVDRPDAPIAAAAAAPTKRSSGSLAPWIAVVAALALLVVGLAIFDARDRRAKRTSN
jgi:hypothetical protein